MVRDIYGGDFARHVIRVSSSELICESDVGERYFLKYDLRIEKTTWRQESFSIRYS